MVGLGLAFSIFLAYYLSPKTVLTVHLFGLPYGSHPRLDPADMPKGGPDKGVELTERSAT